MLFAIDLALFFSIMNEKKSRWIIKKNPSHAARFPILLIPPTTSRQYSQSLNGTERSKCALGNGLKFVVIQRQKVQVVEILESTYPQTIYLVGIEQSVEPRIIWNYKVVSGPFSCKVQ